MITGRQVFGEFLAFPVEEVRRFQHVVVLAATFRTQRYMSANPWTRFNLDCAH